MEHFSTEENVVRGAWSSAVDAADASALPAVAPEGGANDHPTGPPEHGTEDAPEGLPADSADLGDGAAEPAMQALGEVLSAIEAPPELMQAIIEGFADTTDHSARDAEDRSAAEAQAREVWGSQYGQNVKAIRAYLTHSLPPGVGELVMNARINGRALLNDPSVLFYLQQVATSMPAIPSTGDAARDIAAIEGLMGSDPVRYRRDLGLQARLRSLYASRSK